MTREEKHIATRYLQDLDFNEKEFFEEMYDHICSSYENRETSNQDISTHIYQVLEPAFGGKKGLKKLRSAQARTRGKLVLKRGFFLLGAYLFRWPTVLLTALMCILYFQLFQHYDTLEVFYNTLMVGIYIPFVLVHIGVFRFKRKCIKHDRPYTKSQVNNTIYAFSLSGGLFIFLVAKLINWVAYGGTYNSLDFFLKHPISLIPTCILIIVHCLVSLQLFKEKFELKVV